MARPIILSNGELCVGINMYGVVHDFTYPQVGKENHTIGKGVIHRVGVWVDGAVSWIDGGGWTHDFSYDDEALVGYMIAKNDAIGIELHTTDLVYASSSAFIRKIKIVNNHDHERDIRLFMHQAFVIGDTRSNTDTVQYLPDSDAIVHYRGRRVFVVSGRSSKGNFDQYSVGLFGIEGREGTFRDAEDGELSGSSVEHGRVDSTIRFQHTIDANDSATVEYWIAAGTSFHDALLVHRRLRENGVEGALGATIEWWKKWLTPTTHAAQYIPEKYQKLFTLSSRIIRSHTDKNGAVVASADSSMLNYGRDAYGYCWPRDGAYAMWPLIRLGYSDEPLRFFDFCRRGLHPKGYLAHKYMVDGSLGSSWHSYLHEHGVVGAPIQEDETALTVFVFSQYYQIHKDPALLREYYASFIKPMAEFMADHIDPDTLLPRPTYDLWEEVYLTTTYTTSVVYAALLAAADIADDAKDSESAVRWRSVADDIHSGAQKYLFNNERGVFRKGIFAHDGTIEYNDTLDMSAVFGAFMFGLFPIDSAQVTRSMQTVRETFMADGQIGLPRYENDNYQRVNNGPSNYWHITTMWYAQYCIEVGDLEHAEKILDWVTAHTYPSGILSEQINPIDEHSVSVAPLVWSHSEYIATLLDYVSELRDHGE